jgi:hypothetical protein
LGICELYEWGENADNYRSLLRRIYGSFSEGFDTPDLVKAKAMLDLDGVFD